MAFKPSPRVPIEFELSAAEFNRAHRDHLRRALLNFRNVGLITFALVLAALQAQMFGGAGGALRILFGLWVAVVGFLIWAYIKLPGKVYPRHAGRQRLTIDEEALQHEIGSRATRIPWDEITRSRSTPEFYFVYAGSPLPIVIPRRIFLAADGAGSAAAEAAEDAFRMAMIEHLKMVP